MQRQFAFENFAQAAIVFPTFLVVNHGFSKSLSRKRDKILPWVFFEAVCVRNASTSERRVYGFPAPLRGADGSGAVSGGGAALAPG